MSFICNSKLIYKHIYISICYANLKLHQDVQSKVLKFPSGQDIHLRIINGKHSFAASELHNSLCLHQNLYLIIKQIYKEQEQIWT